jgi:hypothetical protein
VTADAGWRRRLVTVAVRDYPGEEASNFRERIDAQVSTVAGWLLDPALQTRAFTREDLTPRSKRCIEDFIHEGELGQLGPADVVVLYVTGHGVQGASGYHYLMLENSDEHQPLTGYRTSQLLTEVLRTDAEHVLVLVDSCHAGALHAEWSLISKDLPQTRRRLSSLAVLTSADLS